MLPEQKTLISKQLKLAIDREVVTANPDITALAAIALMHKTKASCLLIVNQQKLVGIFTEQDVIRVAASAINLQTVAIEAVMVSQVFMMLEAGSNDIDAALKLMKQHHLRYLPVVDSRQHPVGLITKASLLQVAKLEHLNPVNQRLDQSYSNLIENLSEGFFRMTPEGVYLTVNPALAKSSGYGSPQEMIAASHLRQRYVDCDRPAEFIRQLQAHGNIQGFESQICCQDGSIKWVTETAWLVRDDQENVLYYEGISADLGERLVSSDPDQQLETDPHLVAATLAPTEARLRRIYDNTPAMIYQYVQYSDGSTALTHVSSSCLDIYEISPTTALQNADRLWETIHPDDLESVLDALGGATKLLQPRSIECRIQTPSGKLKWVQNQVRPEKQANGSIIWDGIIVDITKLKQTEAALRQSEAQLALQQARLNAFFAASNIGLVIFDDQLRFLHLNEAMAEINGVPVAAHIGHSIREILPQLAPTLEPILYKIFETGEPCFNVEITGQTPKEPNATRYWHASYYPLAGEDGKPFGLGGVITEVTDRKQAEAALQHSEERYRSLVTATSMIVWRAQGSGAIIEAPLWETFTGQTPTEYCDFGWLQAVHPDDRQPTLDRWQQALHTKSPCAAEYRLLHHSGQYHHVIVQGVPIFDASGDIREWIGTVQDINERKQAEAALHESEARLKLTLEATGMGIWSYEPQLQTSYWEESCERLFGVQPGAGIIEFQDFLAYVHPDDRAQVIDAVNTYIRQEFSSKEFRIIRPDGTIRWISDRIRTFFDDLGQPLTVLGISMDITERRLAEEAVRQSEERLRLVLQNMPVMLKVFDANGNIIVWNQECARVTGYTADEVVGNPKAMEMLYPDPGYLQQMRIDWDILGGEYRNWEWNITCKDGSVKPISWSNISREFPVAGWGMWGIGMDMSARKRAEARIIQALEQERELSELKSKFISMVSHEFRTPLSTILSSTELLQKYGDQWPGEKRALRFQRIIEAIDRITKLLNDVLLVGQAEAGKLQFNPTPIELTSFCEELLEELQLSTKEQHKLVFTYEGCQAAGCFDLQLLRHILTNLVSNAIKYSPQGGEIHLHLLYQSQEAIFHVQDSGIGIPLEDQDELFTIFKRGNNVGTISGTGLGLAIVKQCIDLHGGRISVDSKVGSGTRVTVKIPSANLPNSHGPNSRD